VKDLLRSYALVFYRTISLILRFLQRLVSPSLSCHLQNFFLILHGSKLRHSFNAEKGLYIAKEGDFYRYFGDMDRGFDCYARSLMKRGKILSESYCLQNISFNDDDIIIDCGANYGDLYISLRDRIKESNYFAIEPGPVEYRCLKSSLPDAQVLNLGLSDTDGELDFYLCSKSGDSSLLEPKNYTEVIKVQVKTMDSIMRDLNLSKCKLFKLEAEGWEPEILDGAHEFIKICDYIAVDGGRERGVAAEATLHTATNYLIKRGFKMVEIYGPSYRALYQKVK